MTVGAMMPARDETQAPSETTGGRINWVPMLIVLALFALIAWWNWRGLIVVAMLLTAVTLHEVGHLLGAKWAGMRATEFFVGMGPPSTKIWSIRRGETEYGVKAIMLGGYVKTPGLTNLEEIPPEHEARSYRAAPFGKRFRHVLAGPAVNLLLGLLSFCIYFSTTREDVFIDTARQTISVGDDTPARSSGLRDDDVLTGVDGKVFENREAFSTYLRARPGASITIAFERDGKPMTTTAVLASTNPDGEAVGFLGVRFGGEVVTLDGRNVLEGTHRGFTEFGRQVGGTVVGVGQIFGPEGLGRLFQTVSGQREDDGQRATSVIGITKGGSNFIDTPATALFFFGGLNMALGLFNLLPLPPFDGGHLVISMWERFRQRARGAKYRVDFAKVMPYFMPFIFVILFVVGSAFYLDTR